MKIKKNGLLIGVTVLVLSLVVLFLVIHGQSRDAVNPETKFKEITVQRGTFQVSVSANGIVKPIDRIEIKSKASGEIVELPVEVGDYVKKGQLIARLDQRDEKAAVEQARANLDIAKAELKQAQKTYDRRNKLYQSDLLSEEERDQIELSLAVAKGKLVQASSALERAEERLSESIVRAPIDGIILQKYVEEGQIIASGVSNVGGGSPIVDIADMSSVYVEAGIDEIDIGRVEVGQPVKVTAEAYPQLEFEGKIVRIAPEAKIEQNVTLFDVIIEVANPEGKLKSGMNTAIEITILKKENVLLIPTIALMQPKQAKVKPKFQMVLLKEGDHFRKQKVKVGVSNFKQVEIVSGLEEGDILGVPMNSRLKSENQWLENRIKSSRSFGTKSQNRSK
ncbi:MAG: efflux RND transporter periplasmic adaptor subunit [Calditrichia bacterium]